MVRVAVLIVVVGLVVVGAFAGRGSGAVAQEPLSISGTVWEDLNANGLRDPEDPPASGVSMRLQTALDFRSSLGRTDANGHYQFTNVQPGRHIVELDGSRQFYWTYPARAGAGEYTISFNVTTASVSGIDFGVHRPKEHFTVLATTWVFGIPDVGSKVRAFIGATDCTGPTQSILPPSGGGTFLFSVISSRLNAACGDPGDIVRFEVNGLPANETAVWEDQFRPGLQPRIQDLVRLTLTVGPPFGYVRLESVSPAGGETFPLEGTVFGLIDGKLCASNIGTGFTSYLVIPSREYPNGCGYDGARLKVILDGTVVSELDWAAGNLGAIEVPWRPWPGEETGTGEILPPSVGDGGLR